MLNFKDERLTADPGVVSSENGDPGSIRSDHYHHGMLHSLFMFSVFSNSPFRKTLSQRNKRLQAKGGGLKGSISR